MDNQEQLQTLVFNIFGPKFCSIHTEQKHVEIHFYPRGFINIDKAICEGCGMQKKEIGAFCLRCEKNRWVLKL